MSLGALAFLPGCQNDNDEMGVISQKSNVIITATMDGGADTRTILGGDDGKKVYWQEGDKLSVFLANARNQKFGIINGAGSNYAEFQGEEGLIISGGTGAANAMTNVGYYPYSKEISVTQGESGAYTLNVVLPAVQQFVNASFGQEAWPMIAVAETKNDFNLAFKAVATSWKLPLKGTARIVKAYVKSTAKGLAGAATVTASNTVVPVLTMTEDATSTITLDCGENGVQLSESDATTFVFVIPPGTYAAGDLTVTFVDDQGKCMTVATAKAYTIERNEPLNFNERTYAGTEDAPTELSLLQAAIEAGEASYTLTDDITVGASDSKIVIPVNTTFTLDLNGKTITGSNLDFLDNKGTLTISNGKVATDAAITDGSNRRCIYNRAGATMTIDGVEFVQTCESWGAAVNNAGTMVIEDATVDSKYWSIWNETATGNLTIKGGTYNCNSYTESDESSNGGLNGNPTYSYMIKNTSGASLTIDGGTFNCTHGFATLESGSKTVINGGEINHVGQFTISSHTFHVYGAATALTINDCKIKWNTQYIAAGGSSLVWLTESVNAANIAIAGGLYDLTKVTNDSETALAVTFVDSGDATYPYKAVDAGYKQVDATNYEIYNANGLKWLATEVNGGNNFEDATIKLTAPIDLNNEAWTPIGSMTDKKYFQGIFDGGNQTISNLKVSVENNAAGLFGAVENCVTIKNVVISKAVVSSNRQAGALVGFFQENGAQRGTPTISNCSVSDVTVTVTPNQLEDGSYDNGDKAGGLVGYTASEVKIENCKVSGGTITGYRDLGGLVGMANSTTQYGKATITGCTVENVNVVYSATNAYKETAPTTFGEIYGRDGADGVTVVENTTATNVTITWPEEVVALADGKAYLTFADAALAVSDNGVITLMAGDIDLPTQIGDGSTTKTVTVKGAGQDKTNLKGATNSNANYPGNYAHNMTLKFEDLTYTTANKGYNGGFGHAASVEFTNCKIVGQFYAQSNAPHKFVDCTIDPLTGYLYTYASDCDFTRCTFSASEGKALQVYEDANSGENTVNITNCTFTAAKQAQTWDGKPVTAIDINSNGAKFVVNISGCTVTGFPTGLNSNSTLWNVKNLNADITVNVDNQQVYPFYKEVDGGYEISSADGMKWLSSQVAAGTTFSGKTITLTADIDLNNEAWTPIGYGFGGTDSKCFHGTFDGNGKTIKNLNIEEGKSATAGLFGYTSAATIKNFTLENVTINVETPGEGGTGAVVGVLTNCSADQGVIGVTVKGTVSINATRRVGGIVGYADGPVSGCTVTGASLKAIPNLDGTTYDNGDKVGGIAGYMNNNNNVNIVNNKVENVAIEGYRDLGGVAGAGYGTVTGNTVTTATIKAVGVDGSYADSNVPGYVASVVGRKQGTATVDQNTTTGVTMSINGETQTEE